ncbi:GNAT family N-acetyltransferase [Pararhodospirillum photometricum]|uniref:Histone acetyltransferase HPA2 and related acetyltransferase n=1 Tax=Pararhodospirillum photometricum DSM 122 TaxID=1150469 RepID=H6SM52_PARPM|nr:GNAT family N-acetyltransferase [Pararhodospirillum photometricum]CCG09067.1 Histone acetyltransferase HPA2 and related acetyltransferase [Pararhodospirillum photometricum DSM 122]
MTLSVPFRNERIAGCRLRPTTSEDFSWQVTLFSSTREMDREKAPLPDDQWWPLMEMQVLAQESYYREHYPGCRLDVIERNGERIGRLYTGFVGPELRVMDIALLPACRNQGLGTAILTELMEIATSLERPLSLHVEPFNPAHRLYQRLGFQALEMRGIYQYMRWLPKGHEVPSVA